MEAQLEQIREQQRESWNKFSPGWKKWDRLMMDFLKPAGDEIIRKLNPESDDTILDVAAGTGEPGLTIAALLKKGKVVITDLAEDMLKIARENAADKGIKNIQTIACDAGELPFADNSFDGIGCRFGFMFFPDMLLAAKEMTRVLKPGGAMAASVWNVAEKNFWITATMSTIHKHMEIESPPPDAPGMFRCSKEGLMTEIFRQAGLKKISVTEVTGKLNCRTTDLYWKLMTEMAAPVVAALSNAENAMQEKIREEVYQVLNQRYPDKNIRIDSSALVIYGKK